MAITFLNSTVTRQPTAASTFSIVPHSSKHGGGAFILGITNRVANITISTVTDNAGNVFVPAGSTAGGAGSTINAFLWVASNISSASTRISVSLSGNSSGMLALAHFDGISTGSPVDQTGSSQIGVDSTLHSGSQITPAAANAVVVGFAALTGASAGPFENFDNFQTWASTAGSSQIRLYGNYLIQTVASTATAQFDSTASCQHHMVIASFHDTVSGAAPAVLFPGGFALMGIQ